jgi:hypothetical protein
MKKTLFILLASFLIISCGNGYTKENGNVYYVIQPKSFAEHGGQGGKILLKNADAYSFEELDIGYGKDKKNVYLEGRLIKNADPETFEIIDFVDRNKSQYKCYSKDKNYVFYFGEQIQNANPKTFQVPVEKEE